MNIVLPWCPTPPSLSPLSPLREGTRLLRLIIAVPSQPLYLALHSHLPRATKTIALVRAEGTYGASANRLARLVAASVPFLTPTFWPCRTFWVNPLLPLCHKGPFLAQAACIKNLPGC